ncbi:unnamed protein product, partial [Mycena citricolor]
TRERPRELSDSEYQSFIRYVMEFYLSDGTLWRKHPDGRHKLVVLTERRLVILHSAHDDVCHKGFYATRALIAERFWWPHMAHDIAWYVRTCDLCQQRQIRKVTIPPTVAVP